MRGTHLFLCQSELLVGVHGPPFTRTLPVHADRKAGGMGKGEDGGEEGSRRTEPYCLRAPKLVRGGDDQHDRVTTNTRTRYV